VTRGAHAIRISMVRREPGVIESRIQPVRGGVARVASCRESGRRMVRIGRTLVVPLVARVAIRRYRRVVVVHVAIRAGRCCVRAGQRKRRVVVIKRRLRPGGCVVAQIASLRESRCHVIGIGGPVEIGQMATRTGGARQVIVVIHMTLRTLQRCVRTCERESRGRMVKRGA